MDWIKNVLGTIRIDDKFNEVLEPDERDVRANYDCAYHNYQWQKPYDEVCEFYNQCTEVTSLVGLSKYINTLRDMHQGCYPTGGVQFVNRVGSYTDLMTLPIGLGQFIPCDEDGNAFGSPSGLWMDEDYEALERAKKRVMFVCEIKSKRSDFIKITLPCGTTYSFRQYGYEGTLLHEPPATIEKAIDSGVKLYLKHDCLRNFF